MSFTRDQLPRWTPAEYRSRPREFDPGLAEQICDRVANGEVLAEVCRDRDMPLPATFFRWMRDDPTLTRAWQQAQLDRLDVFSEECVLIADTGDAKQTAGSIAARQWAAERLNPKKFAQRTVSVGLSGGAEDEGAGVDYGRDVRRKLDEMAARRREEVPAAAEAGFAGSVATQVPESYT